MKTMLKKMKGVARGQSLVEFSISLTFIIILLAGVVDFGRGFFTLVELRDAAQEGALYGSIYPTDADAIRNRAMAASNTPINLESDPAIQIQVDTDTACEGGIVSVTVSYTYPISMPLLGAIIGAQSIPLRATAKDVILIPACT
jgi:Flp pilus assembly protein TadG